MFFTRRYQVIFLVCLVFFIAVAAFSLILRPSSQTGFFRKIVIETVAPLESFITMTFRGIGDIWDSYVFLIDLEKDNQNLAREVALLTNKLNTYREMALECERLRALMALEETLPYPVVTARVIARNQASVFNTVLINRGTSDGLKIDSPVMAAQGIVGRIIEISWNVSKVLLLTDYNSNIDVLIQKSRARGMLQGAGSRKCILKYVQRSEIVEVGDMVVSSGLAGIYPKGLLLGRVTQVFKEDSGLFQAIEVEPVVNVAKIEEVFVIVSEAKECR